MTQRPMQAELMAGFKSGFGVIVDLVTETSEQKGPWVTERIGKMSKKAQDEIYGRFNEAFNDGVKNAAKGREHYESSLDFPALAQKTTEVADDIELADKINKLFEKHAQIKTIHEQYKKLSASARKEIEQHLGSTAEKAQPKELQKALITVFNGMGRLSSETTKSSASSSSSKTSSSSKSSSSSSSSSSAKSSSSSSSSSTSSKTSSKSADPRSTAELDNDPELAKILADLQKPEIREMITDGMLSLAKPVKKDIDLANAHADILAAPKTDGTEAIEETQVRDEGIPKLYQKFSKPARCMIEKILIEQSQGCMKTYTSADEAHSDDLRKAIQEFFDVYVYGSIHYDRLSEKWKFDEEEAIFTEFYLRVSADSYNVLPKFKDNKPVVAAKEFEDLAKTVFSKLTKTQLQVYAPLLLKFSQMPYKQAYKVVCKEQSKLMKSLMIIQDRQYDRTTAFEFYKQLPPQAREYIQAHLDDNDDKITFKKASTPQRNKAVEHYISSLVAAQVIKQEEAEALQNATLSFALFFLKDSQILRQNAAFLKIKEAKYRQDQAKVLEIFDSLSPYAKLLVEQEFIREYPAGLSEEKTKADTVRALVADGSPDFVKGSMLTLLDGIDQNLAIYSIMHGMKLENLGTMEKLLLNAYLGYPRHICFAFLQSDPKGSAQAFVKYLSVKMESIHPTVIKEFQDTVTELASQKAHYKHLFTEFTEQAAGIKDLTEDAVAEGCKELLFSKRAYTKRDFYQEVMSLGEKIEEILDQ